MEELLNLLILGAIFIAGLVITCGILWALVMLGILPAIDWLIGGEK